MSASPLLSRRATLVMIAGACLGACTGCERDDTVRGAGSIDVPIENLKFEPAPGKGLSGPRSKPKRNQ